MAVWPPCYRRVVTPWLCSMHFYPVLLRRAFIRHTSKSIFVIHLLVLLLFIDVVTAPIVGCITMTDRRVTRSQTRGRPRRLSHQTVNSQVTRRAGSRRQRCQQQPLGDNRVERHSKGVVTPQCKTTGSSLTAKYRRTLGTTTTTAKEKMATRNSPKSVTDNTDSSPAIATTATTTATGISSGDATREGGRGADMVRLWEVDLPYPATSLAYDSDQRCLWGRGGGRLWRTTISAEGAVALQDGRVSLHLLDFELGPGDGLCVDSKRHLLVTCSGPNLTVLTPGGEVVKVFTPSEEHQMSEVVYCSNNDAYIAGHAVRPSEHFMSPYPGKFPFYRIRADGEESYPGLNDAITMDSLTVDDLEPLCLYHEDHECGACSTVTATSGGLSKYSSFGSMRFGNTIQYPAPFQPRTCSIIRDSLSYIILTDCVNNRLLRYDLSEWEVLLKSLTGSGPYSLALVDNKYLIVGSSGSPPYKLSCFLYPKDSSQDIGSTKAP